MIREKWTDFKDTVIGRGSYLSEVGKADRGKYATCSAGKLILNKRSLIETHLPTYKIKRKKRSR